MGMQPINLLQDLSSIEFDHRAVFVDYLEGIKLGTEVGIKIAITPTARSVCCVAVIHISLNLPHNLYWCTV